MMPDQLQQHVKRVHNAIMLHCPKCLQTFTRREYLRRHLENPTACYHGAKASNRRMPPMPSLPLPNFVPNPLLQGQVTNVPNPLLQGPNSANSPPSEDPLSQGQDQDLGANGQNDEASGEMNAEDHEGIECTPELSFMGGDDSWMSWEPGTDSTFEHFLLH